jgi:histidinol dehydrogenase
MMSYCKRNFQVQKKGDEAVAIYVAFDGVADTSKFKEEIDPLLQLFQIIKAAIALAKENIINFTRLKKQNASQSLKRSKA